MIKHETMCWKGGSDKNSINEVTKKVSKYFLKHFIFLTYLECVLTLSEYQNLQKKEELYLETKKLL